MPTEPAPALSRSRLIRLTVVAAAVTSAVAAVMVLPLWFSVLVPRWFVRGLTVGLLWSTFAAFLATLTLAPIGAAASFASARRARRLRRPWAGAARGFLLCTSCLLGAAFLEAGASVGRAWSRRLPTLNTHFERPATDPGPSAGRGRARSPSGPLRIVVIGESSARGEPYNPWLSVGQVVGWQLEKVLGRPVEVDIRAQGGVRLDQAIEQLDGLETAPDAILLFSGHNEFQSRFGWDRNVAYYTEGGARPPLEVVLEAAARRSSLCGWVRETLEAHRLDVPPPHKVTRKLVDSPGYTSWEFATTLADFRRRLEQVVSYCEAVGALPMLLIPAGNDADFEPNRSVMTRTSSAAEREAFARDFRAARALGSTDPARAESAFRGLVDRQPGFAEAHFRLARLVEGEGRWGEARDHYARARDLDGLTQRIPSAFQHAYREVAARHDGVVLVDAPAVLTAVSPRHGLLGDELFHDAHHPNLLGYVALARDMLKTLKARRAFGWPDDQPAPVLRVDEVVAHFRIDAAKWAEVCRRSWTFYQGTAYIRYDPSGRLEKARRYGEAHDFLKAGGSPRRTGLPSLRFLENPEP